MLKRLSGGLVSAAGVDRIAARASMMERSAAAVMLLPVQCRFEVGLWGSPTTLFDASSTFSKDLFFPDGTERLGMRSVAKE